MVLFYFMSYIHGCYILFGTPVVQGCTLYTFQCNTGVYTHQLHTCATHVAHSSV